MSSNSFDCVRPTKTLEDRLRLLFLYEMLASIFLRYELKVNIILAVFA